MHISQVPSVRGIRTSSVEKHTTTLVSTQPNKSQLKHIDGIAMLFTIPIMLLKNIPTIFAIFAICLDQVAAQRKLTSSPILGPETNLIGGTGYGNPQLVKLAGNNELYWTQSSVVKQSGETQLCGVSMNSNEAGGEYICGRFFRISNGEIQKQSEIMVSKDVFGGNEGEQKCGSQVVSTSSDSVMSFFCHVHYGSPNTVWEWLGRMVYTNGTLGVPFRTRPTEIYDGFSGAQVGKLNNGNVLMTYIPGGIDNINAILFSPIGNILKSVTLFNSYYYQSVSGSHTEFSNGDILFPILGYGSAGLGTYGYRMTNNFEQIRLSSLSGSTDFRSVTMLNNSCYRLWVASGNTLMAKDFDSNDQPIGTAVTLNAESVTSKTDYQIVNLKDNTTVIGWQVYQNHGIGLQRGYVLQHLDRNLQNLSIAFQLGWSESDDQANMKFVNVGDQLGAGYGTSRQSTHGQFQVYFKTIDFSNGSPPSPSPSISPLFMPTSTETRIPTVSTSGGQLTNSPTGKATNSATHPSFRPTSHPNPQTDWVSLYLWFIVGGSLGLAITAGAGCYFKIYGCGTTSKKQEYNLAPILPSAPDAPKGLFPLESIIVPLDDAAQKVAEGQWRALFDQTTAWLKAPLSAASLELVRSYHLLSQVELALINSNRNEALQNVSLDADRFQILHPTNSEIRWLGIRTRCLLDNNATMDSILMNAYVHSTTDWEKTRYLYLQEGLYHKSGNEARLSQARIQLQNTLKNSAIQQFHPIQKRENTSTTVVCHGDIQLGNMSGNTSIDSAHLIDGYHHKFWEMIRMLDPSLGSEAFKPIIIEILGEAMIKNAISFGLDKGYPTNRCIELGHEVLDLTLYPDNAPVSNSWYYLVMGIDGNPGFLRVASDKMATYVQEVQQERAQPKQV